jgi:uncharacterized protein YutE (UPF0331/DUF86 family)
MRQESSEVLIEVIRIIPSLFWQIIILIALFIYKKEIILFLKKIKKGSFFWNDFELSNDIDKLETKVEKIKENTPINSEIFWKNNSDWGINFDWDRKMVLIQIAIEIEKEIKKIMLSTWWSNNQNVISVKQSFLFLIKNWALPNNLSSSIDIFLDIRNKIIHSHWMVSDDEILRMVDLWLSLLKSIRAIPHEINKVYKKDIDLYTDNELKNKIDNARWLLLETTSAWEAIKTFRIFPTTKDSYIEWKMVSWEWSFDNQWGETYYKHPISKKIELAWNSSAEFIWRILD